MEINRFSLSLQTIKPKDKQMGESLEGAELGWGRDFRTTVPGSSTAQPDPSAIKEPTHFLRVPFLCQLAPRTLAKQGAASIV